MKTAHAVVQAARDAKHRGWVAYQPLRWKIFRARGAVYKRLGQRRSKRQPRFDPSRYPGTFIVQHTVTAVPSGIPRRVFAVWTGDNDLTPNRARNLDLMRERLGVDVELITPTNLSEWVVASHPLHPAYGHLSLLHRSDYLRAYLLHHHGGGYMDIKEPRHSWRDSFDQAESDAEAWYTGRPETHATDIAPLPGRLGRDIWLSWTHMVGQQSAICRAGSPLTAEWIDEIHHRLDIHFDALLASPGDIRVAPPGYPLKWQTIGSNVLHPLQLKYLDHVRSDRRLDFSWDDYQ